MVIKWFKPKTHSGWQKDMPMAKRRRLVLKAHKNDYLAAGRSMQSLANVSQDKRTSDLAAQDAKYFFREHKKRKKR